MHSAFDDALDEESGRASDARARTQGKSKREVEGSERGPRCDARRTT